ncbi:MAG: aldo/keto reductase [Victivallales bacterium]|nr:aldo/keto reductase [Victivallales bacterium]
MQYRPFGSLDFQVSALGFGMMRLPTNSDDAADINIPEAIAMVRRAIDAGVNYIDTAYPYHGGQSEVVTALALADGYREKVKLVTKLPTWMVTCEADVDRLLDEQIARLGGAFIDIYLIHNVSRGGWPTIQECNIVGRLEAAKAAGKIGAIGFSFHDDFELLKEVVDSYDWDVAQIQYNYMNENVQSGTAGLEYAASKGLAVVIMEPLLGGCLVDTPPPVNEILAEGSVERTPADWALQWLWNKPEVATVLSGMSAMEHVDENVASAASSGVGSLSEADVDVMRRAAETYQGLTPIPCTRCRYCMPCPEGVDIPSAFSLYNGIHAFGGNQGILNRIIYSNFPAADKADNCVACGLCEEKCPQKIAISELLPEVHEFLSRPPKHGE